MTIQPGTRLGPYEILAPLGAGGMGEVYKAKDPRLDRFVAVKVLPEHLVASADALARFEREGRAVAALNHPNILALFDIGHEEATVFAVMELLEGESLRGRLAVGPLPPRKATELAIQMAQGLSAAHEKGVIHRDLKPDNLWITKEGRLKILDFGLAKQTGTSRNVAQSMIPTGLASPDRTEEGMVLGTAGYMSPEQVRGETVDARSDIFSFGAVLHEMLTGRRAFARDTPADTMAAILKEDPPDLEGTSRPVPAGLERVLRHCLEKDPAHRFQDARDLGFALENLTGSESVASLAVPFTRQNRQATRIWGGVAAVLLAAAGFAGWSLRKEPEAPVRRWELLAGSQTSPPIEQAILSPDGRRVVYPMGGRLWVRDLADGQAREVPGSEHLGGTPFWSPDGSTLAFNAQGRIWRSALGGEAPLAVCEVPKKDIVMCGAWLKGGDLLLSVWRSDIYRVPASGGTPRVELTLDHAKDVDYHCFCVLPDGESVLAVLHTQKGVHQVELIRGKRRTVLVQDDRAEFSQVAYAAPGFLLFTRAENSWTPLALWAAPFSASRGKLTGPAFLVEPSVADFSLAGEGLMALLTARPAKRELLWLDENGRTVETLGTPLEEAAEPCLSPDGRRAAVCANTTRGRDVWMLDVGGRTWSPATDSRASCDGLDWSPDGRRIAFQLQGTGDWMSVVHTVNVEGGEAPRKVVQGSLPLFTPDGSSLLFQRDQDGDYDIMRIPAGGGSSEPVIATPSIEAALAFSPDGRWMLYLSNESGDFAVYARRYPGGGEKQTLNLDGSWLQLRSYGRFKRFRWMSNGRIYFWNGRAMGVLEADTRQGLVLGKPRQLFQDPGQGIDLNQGFDVDPRTGRILALRDVAGASLDTHVIRVIENPGTLLTRRSATR